MAIKLGITGGIGSGKSVVSHLLSIMGIPVYIADDEAKRITSTDPIIKQQLIALLGEEVFVEGMLNKPFLAAYLFANEQNAQIINKIIHPRVKADFVEWATSNEHCPILAMESAILIESGFASEVDYIVMVSAPLEVRIQRAMKRDSVSQELVKKRIENQMDDEKKKEYAHFVINNNDEDSLIVQVNQLLKELSAQRVS